MLNRYYLVARQQVSVKIRLVTFACGLSMGLILSALILMANGVSLADIVDEFVVLVFLDKAGLALALTSFIPLVLVGLAAAAAIKLQFWNIGIEGQMWMGATAATFVATYDIGPPELRLLLMFLSAAAAGALWIGIPAWLKLRWQVNEIITTLLLSYVAFLFVQHLLYGVWRDPDSGFPASPLFEEGLEQLAKLGWQSLHQGIWVALAAVALMWWVVGLSRFGLYMQAVGSNARAAKAAGVPVVPTIIGAVILSGGLAGIAGLTIVAGQEYRLTVHVSEGFTFSAIVIAFVARFHPIGVMVAALVIAGIYTAGDALKVFYQLPEATVVLIESVILLSILIAEFFGRYHIGRRQARPA